MEHTGSHGLVEPIRQGTAAQRAELETVLKDLLVRPSNMRRLLCYVCEKYFAGQVADIKEYTIAVEALGRSPEFDPTADSIVRVEAHRLRSKLDRYYKQSDVDHQIQISLPSGGYVPEFRYRALEERSGVTADQPNAFDLSVDKAEDSRSSFLSSGQEPTNDAHWFESRSVWAASLLLLTIAASIGWVLAHRALAGNKGSDELSTFSEAGLATRSSADNSGGIRITAGTQFSGQLDWGGDIWVADRYFSGGEAADSAHSTFELTTTPTLYIHRRRGTFSYAIPLRKGIYELKLHFADAYFGAGNPDEGGESSRLFDVKANGKTLLHDFDVISDAGGPNTADVKVFSDIEPAKDGFLHLDFLPNRNVPFVNAIEVLPAASTKMLPIRIYTGLNSYKDAAGVVWNADRYFRGGVHYHSRTDQAAPGDSDVRFGNFVYQIPVVAGESYTAILRFCPIQLPVGSNSPANIFDILMNGRSLLESFQLPTQTSRAGCIVKAFHSLSSNAQGKLTFAFVPSSGYASVTSIAIDPE